MRRFFPVSRDTTVTVTVMRQGQEEYQEMEIEVLLQE